MYTEEELEELEEEETVWLGDYRILLTMSFFKSRYTKSLSLVL